MSMRLGPGFSDDSPDLIVGDTLAQGRALPRKCSQEAIDLSAVSFSRLPLVKWKNRTNEVSGSALSEVRPGTCISGPPVLQTLVIGHKRSFESAREASGKGRQPNNADARRGLGRERGQVIRDEFDV